MWTFKLLFEDSDIVRTGLHWDVKVGTKEYTGMTHL